MFRKKRPKQPKTLYKENLDCVQCQNQCMNPSVSVKNRSLRDSSRMRTRTRTRNGSMDACLSFTTVSIFTDTDTYTDHGHGSQFTDLWMASLRLSNRSRSKSCFEIQFFISVNLTEAKLFLTRQDLIPGLLDLQSSILTTRPQRPLTDQCYITSMR